MPASAAAERVVPHNLEAERALLGSILLDNQALNVALEALGRDDFFSESNRVLFERMQKLSEGSRAIDLVTLAEELLKDGLLEKVGGASYLASLTDGIPIGTTAAASAYARIVKEKSLIRRLINASNNTISRCLEGNDDAETLIDAAQTEVFEVAADEKAGSGFTSITQILPGLQKQLEGGRIANGIPTGLEKLDEMTCGLQPGELIIIAARPSLGKTALALNIAAHAAIEKGKRVGFFSLEMTKEALGLRLLCAEGRVDSHRVRGGFLSREHDWPKVMGAIGRLALAPIHVEDTPALSIMQIRAKARRLRAEKKGLDMIIVDYLQLVSGHGAATGQTRFDNRTQEVSFISRGLKSIAKELNVPVVALSQLSRAPEAGKGREPQLSDLRDSGSIEQDADVVIFISRGRQAGPDTIGAGAGNGDAPHEGVEVRLVVGKQRNGPTGEIPVVFQKAYTSFENLAPERDDGF
ncbi:MAG TPA: replicative DNA helicase [Terriglobia bacterium]|nr:replicative DNA helicase [Terriglobia bacterium]